MTLKDTVAQAGITDAHIVDDAFDVLPGAGLQDAPIHTFLSALNSAQFDAVADLLGVPGGDEDTVVERLRHREGAAALWPVRATYGEAADRLLQDFAQTVGPERDLLNPLLVTLERLGIRCHTFGRDYAPHEEPPPQMLFVDLKLTEDRIRVQEPVAVIKKMREHYHDAHPLVFLMSTQQGSLEAERDTFREASKLFSSQFEDIAKRKIEKQAAFERFLEHHVQVYRRIVALQRHVESWSRAMALSQRTLETTLRKLDLADYFVLHNTASADRIKLGGYVTDLLLEYVAYQIEGSADIGAFAKELDSWDPKLLTRSHFNIQPLVADIFAANVLHAFERLEWERDRGLGPTHGFLRLGDVFFRRAEVENGPIESAVVVLQPACDLVRPDSVVKREATILLCKGKVKQLRGASKLLTEDNLDPVILRFPAGTDTRYVVTWQKKQACFWAHTELERLKTPSTHEWVHVGRLRSLYALQLQRAVTAELSRVGTQRRPVTYVAHGIEVLIPKHGKWSTLAAYAAEPSAGAIADDKREQRKTFMVSDVIIRETFDRLDDWLGVAATEPATETLRRLADCPEAIRALMFHTASTAPEDKGKLVFPLATTELPDGMRDLLGNSVVLATQRPEDSRFSTGRDVVAGESSVMVFRFIRINV